MTCPWQKQLWLSEAWLISFTCWTCFYRCTSLLLLSFEALYCYYYHSYVYVIWIIYTEAPSMLLISFHSFEALYCYYYHSYVYVIWIIYTEAPSMLLISFHCFSWLILTERLIIWSLFVWKFPVARMVVIGWLWFRYPVATLC